MRAWLEANLPAGFSERSELELRREWNRTLADAGYAAIAWPTEYGGRGASVIGTIVDVPCIAAAGLSTGKNPGASTWSV